MNEQRKVERRQINVDYNRRKFNRREKEFLFQVTVYLTDTNAMGNTYFARYFDWQGKTREDFFKYVMPDYATFLQKGIKLITLEAHMKYLYESKLYDEVQVKMKLGQVKQTSVELLFEFYDKKTDKKIAQGAQKVAFADSVGKYIPVPAELFLATRKIIANL